MNGDESKKKHPLGQIQPGYLEIPMGFKSHPNQHITQGYAIDLILSMGNKVDRAFYQPIVPIRYLILSGMDGLVAWSILWKG